MNRNHLVLAAILVLSAACSNTGNDSSSTTSTGTSTTSATSSTAGAGGATSSSSSSAGGGGSGTGGSPDGSCKPGDPNACPADQYCNAPDCQTGTCAMIGTEQPNEMPVCGCDGVTYWNSSVASSRGMSVVHSGACSPGTACGGPSNTPCADGQVCNIHLASPGDCSAQGQSGQCWAMPVDCPITIGSPQNSTCDQDPWCADECSVIKAGKPWISGDDSCPL